MFIGLANADGGIVIGGLRARKVERNDLWPELCNAQLQASIDYCEPSLRVRWWLVARVNERAQRDHLLATEVAPRSRAAEHGKRARRRPYPSTPSRARLLVYLAGLARGV